jgi:hypothetical protein
MEIQDQNYEENTNPGGIEDQPIPGDPSETLDIDGDDSDLTDEEVAGLDDDTDESDIDDDDYAEITPIPAEDLDDLEDDDDDLIDDELL